MAYSILFLMSHTQFNVQTTQRLGIVCTSLSNLLKNITCSRTKPPYVSGRRPLPANNGITQVKYLKTVLKVETDHFPDCQSVLVFVGDLVLGGVEKFLLKPKFMRAKNPVHLWFCNHCCAIKAITGSREKTCQNLCNCGAGGSFTKEQFAINYIYHRN